MSIQSQNLSDQPPEILRAIFYQLSAKEVFANCPISKEFNQLCHNDYLWRDKYLLNYGLSAEKFIGFQYWKDMVKFLVLTQMFNLNEIWIDGNNYRSLYQMFENDQSQGQQFLSYVE